MQCHAKQTSDFVFQGACSSLFCSAGHSPDSRNVALWDTLMPQKRALVQSFIFHESGASAVVHAPQHQQLVTGGKRGQVCIFFGGDERDERGAFGCFWLLLPNSASLWKYFYLMRVASFRLLCGTCVSNVRYTFSVRTSKRSNASPSTPTKSFSSPAPYRAT